jgi:coenzyme F420-reducing hydrogenase delta subunit
LKSAGAKIRARLLPAILPCAGTLDLSRVIAAFQEGAEGVLVGTCHIGNCASIYGNVLAAERLSRVREVLQEAGIDPARLSLVTLASNTPGDLARAVLNLEETMLKLSPYGLTSESEVKRRVSQ